MNLKRFTIALLLTMVLGSFLQAQVRNCGTMEYLEYQQQQEPNRSLKMMEIERHTNDYLEGHERVDGVITIPVVVHVVWNTAAENISDAQIQSQIDILNEDFRRLNTDASNTPADFQGIAADSEIEFCLATVDPNGASTNGITRTQTSVTAFSTNDAVKFNSSGGKDAWPASDYLNIWVCDISGGILGYAQFPGGSAATDGVVNDYQYFGNIGTATAPFDLGRTCTHEIGHWLNLRHIWGDGNCSVDDFVNDTPTADGPNYTGGACTYPGPNSCNDGAGDLPDMFQNYMDYSDDGCMNLFTLGQKARMRALFNTGGARESLLNSDACGMATPPTCEDGIQNGDETGVDCGGTNCPPCPCNAGPLTLTITFDSYPGETSWDVTDIGGAVVASGGTYGSESAGSTIMVPVNLPDGDYTFTIYDSFGDGICCTYGNGSYSLVDNNGTTIASGGDFDGSEATSFCVISPDPVSGCTDPNAHNYNPLATVDDGSCETCSDGIQNGDETGVDCGGALCPTCPVPGCTDPGAHNYDPTATVDDGSCETCADGLQNGDETGVDCGGVLCEACALPDGWTTEEEGINCGTLTNADYSAGTFSLSAEDCSVPGYYSTTDGQAFISQELCGDGELIAHVSSISGNAWAGIAFRESNDPGAKMLQIAVSNSGLASRRIRVTTGGIAFNHTFLNQNQFWLKLTRMGNQFGAYMSSDGINWSVVILTYIPMSNCIQTGMFVSNMTPGSMATADFDQVQLNGGMAYSSGSRQGADLTDLKRDFVVYPNPTSGLLNIALDAYMDQALEVKVYNQVGQIVLTQIFQDRHASVETLQFGQLESGLYLIQLHADDKVATQKVNVIR